MAALATIATVATGAAAVIGAGASVYQGFASMKQADDQARQFQEQGRAEFASSQRDAIERRLQGQIVLSAQQAAAAASGGGAGGDAPTIVRLMTETQDRADYGADSALYQGKSTQDRYNKSADAVLGGKANNFIGSLLDGVGTLLGGAGQTYAMADRLNILPKARVATPAGNWGW